MLVGYARVSTGDQNPDAQLDALRRAGVAEEHLYVDYTSGAKSSRPQWDVVQRVLRAGDTLVCTRLDRVGRSTAHLVTTLDELRRREINLRFLEQGIDTTTAEGRMIYRMLAAVAEFQHDLIQANTREGLAAARARGRKGGRRPKLTREQVELAQQLYDAREKTVQQIAELFGVPRTTVYNHLNTTKPRTTPSSEATPARDERRHLAVVPDQHPPASEAPERHEPTPTVAEAPRAVEPRERIDLDTVQQQRTDSGDTRVVARIRSGERVLVGFLQHAGGRKWQAHTPGRIPVGRPQRTKRDALLRLVESHQ